MHKKLNNNNSLKKILIEKFNQEAGFPKVNYFTFILNIKNRKLMGGGDKCTKSRKKLVRVGGFVKIKHLC